MIILNSMIVMMKAIQMMMIQNQMMSQMIKMATCLTIVLMFEKQITDQVKSVPNFKHLKISNALLRKIEK